LYVIYRIWRWSSLGFGHADQEKAVGETTILVGFVVETVTPRRTLLRVLRFSFVSHFINVLYSFSFISNRHLIYLYISLTVHHDINLL
jgi:hypothetical protein